MRIKSACRGYGMIRCHCRRCRPCDTRGGHRRLLNRVKSRLTEWYRAVTHLSHPSSHWSRPSALPTLDRDSSWRWFIICNTLSVGEQRAGPRRPLRSSVPSPCLHTLEISHPHIPKAAQISLQAKYLKTEIANTSRGSWHVSHTNGRGRNFIYFYLLNYFSNCCHLGRDVLIGLMGLLCCMGS